MVREGEEERYLRQVQILRDHLFPYLRSNVFAFCAQEMLRDQKDPRAFLARKAFPDETRELLLPYCDSELVHRSRSPPSSPCSMQTLDFSIILRLTVCFGK